MTESCSHPSYVSTMSSIISIPNVSKTYKGGFTALRDVSLEIERGEILALL